jgi:hypothetical protein
VTNWSSSALLERAARIRAGNLRPSGSPAIVRLKLRPDYRSGTPPETIVAAKLLVGAGLALRDAHAAVTTLMGQGHIEVHLPAVEALDSLVSALSETGVLVEPAAEG